MHETILELGLSLVGFFVILTIYFFVMDAIFDRVTSRKIMTKIRQKWLNEPQGAAEQKEIEKLRSEAHAYLESLYGPEDRLLEAHELFASRKDHSRSFEEFIQLIEQRQDESFNIGFADHLDCHECAVCKRMVVVGHTTIFTGSYGGLTVSVDGDRPARPCTCANGYFRDVLSKYGTFVRSRFHEIKKVHS